MNIIQLISQDESVLDRFDRKILTALSQDAMQTYAKLGKKAGLSAPAVYERVRKLRANGTIRSTTVHLDGGAVGKPLLAFVQVAFTGWGKTSALRDLAEFPEVEEMHSIAGDAGLLIKIRSADTHALECFLAKLYELEGVSRTRTSVVLSTFLERSVQPNKTSSWDVDLMPSVS